MNGINVGKKTLVARQLECIEDVIEDGKTFFSRGMIGDVMFNTENTPMVVFSIENKLVKIKFEVMTSPDIIRYFRVIE